MSNQCNHSFNPIIEYHNELQCVHIEHDANIEHQLHMDAEPRNGIVGGKEVAALAKKRKVGVFGILESRRVYSVKCVLCGQSFRFAPEVYK